MARRRKAYGVAVNPACPVEIDHPLNQGLQHWWNAVSNPGWHGSLLVRDAMILGPSAKTGQLNGTFVNNGSGLPTWTDGGKSFKFTGTSSYVSVPYAVTDPIVNWTAITVAFWFKGSNIQSAIRLQTNNPNYVVVGWGGTPNSNQIIISGDGGTSGLTIGGCEDSNWHHLVFRWIKNTVNGWQWWVDGKINAQRNAGNVILADLTSHGYLAGFGQYNGTPSFEPTTGSIRDVKLYSTYANAYQLYQEARLGNRNTLRWLSTKVYSFKAGGAVGATTGRLASFYAQFRVG